MWVFDSSDPLQKALRRKKKQQNNLMNAVTTNSIVTRVLLGKTLMISNLKRYFYRSAAQNCLYECAKICAQISKAPLISGQTDSHSIYLNLSKLIIFPREVPENLFLPSHFNTLFLLNMRFPVNCLLNVPYPEKS